MPASLISSADNLGSHRGSLKSQLRDLRRKATKVGDAMFGGPAPDLGVELLRAAGLSRASDA
jgi:hypothetical protein